ncbi:hypothetical protein B379_08030 [Anoxybacillus ayderensis G10]|uniref:glycosyltransferase n=1 Tax=Anoxybacillus gonensis TaxID=198467 RepID=UPI000315259D|nr:hypothetical protein B379_08030 [Anoxybacillus ayderensis G10]
MIVCTSICANYLPKAMVLAKSVKQYNPDAKVVVCIVEREIPLIAMNNFLFDEVVLAKDLGFENFEHFIFRHSIVEASTAVKGQLFRYLLGKYDEELEFIYLDPDIKVYGPLIELREMLQTYPIVLTPHLCDQENTLDAVMDNELSALKHGAYNLGFLSINRSQESKEFIEWWASRLEMFCYNDIPNGIFTDQKWIDLAPCFFNVHIFKHRGYNVAPWNLSKRKITTDEHNNYIVNGKYRLRFFHFSGFDSGANEAMINKYVPDKNDLVYKLRDEYVRDCIGMKQQELGSLRWSYDYFRNGEKILPEARIAFRTIDSIRFKYFHPFDELNNEFLIQSLHKYMKKEGLKSKIRSKIKAILN